MSLPWGIMGIVLAIVLGTVWVDSWLHPEDGPSVRMIIPFYGCFVYWVLACLVNFRTAVVTPHRVWVIVWPLPVRLPQWTLREKVRRCFIRRVATCDDGTELESYYMCGLETLSGLQIELSGPHPEAEAAWEAAGRVAGVLNAGREGHEIEIEQIGQIPSRPQIAAQMLMLLLWVVFCFGALYLGFAWEDQYQLLKRAG